MEGSSTAARGKKKREKRDSISGIIRSRYARHFIAKYKWNYLIGLVFLFIIDALQTKVPIVVGDVIDGIELNTIDMSGIWKQVGILALIALIVLAGRILWRYFIFGSSRKIERDIRNDIFEHLEKMPTRYFQEHKAGELMAHMTNDLETVRMTFAQSIMMTLDIVTLGSLTLYNMITKIDFRLTILAVIPMLFIALYTLVMGPKMHARFTQKQEAFSQLSDFVQEKLNGIKVIKAFVQEDKENEAFDQVNKLTYRKNISHIRLRAFMHPFMSLISGFSMALAIAYGGYITIFGRISVGSFAAFIQYLGMLVWPMMSVGMTINTVTMGSASLKRIEKILDTEPEIFDRPGIEPIAKIGGSISVNHMTYRYPATHADVLHDIDFELRQGQTLGIIGRTGSGKTTLVNLFLRIFDAKPGDITIGGKDILDIPLSTLRTGIGYVPQDNFLFSDSVSANIAFGRRDADQAEIEAAAQAACVHDNIVEFSRGYETMVGERGVSLSGGQKQRISIARALIKNPEILILDDAVSAVDTDTEEKILSHLKTTRQGKTNVIIAHRISTIQHADLILVLDEGRIVERGTHEELIAQEGLYKSLHEKQLLEKMLQEEA